VGDIDGYYLTSEAVYRYFYRYFSGGNSMPLSDGIFEVTNDLKRELRRTYHMDYDHRIITELVSIVRRLRYLQYCCEISPRMCQELSEDEQDRVFEEWLTEELGADGDVAWLTDGRTEEDYNLCNQRW
jgi:hypothetical protein